MIQEGESLENALRRFKRKVQQEDIIKEIKKHSFYMKPGEKRRAKEALSRKRLRKKQRRETQEIQGRPGQHWGSLSLSLRLRAPHPRSKPPQCNVRFCWFFSFLPRGP